MIEIPAIYKYIYTYMCKCIYIAIYVADYIYILNNVKSVITVIIYSLLAKWLYSLLILSICYSYSKYQK